MVDKLYLALTDNVVRKFNDYLISGDRLDREQILPLLTSDFSGDHVIIARGHPTRDDKSRHSVDLRVLERRDSCRVSDLHLHVFSAVPKEECLLVLGISPRLLHLRAKRAQELEVKLSLTANRWEHKGSAFKLADMVQGLRTREEQGIAVEQALADWKSYLDVEILTSQRTAFEAQYDGMDVLTNSEHPRSQQQLVVVFQLDRWEKPVGLENIRKGTDVLVGDERQIIGRVESVAEDGLVVRVRLNREVSPDSLPRKSVIRNNAGVSFFSADVQKKAIKRLQEGDLSLSGPLGLEEILFGNLEGLQFPELTQAETVQREDCLWDMINDAQLAAVNACINTPDLFLLQGPPGTGKTTFIAELCFHAATLGQRVLVASQANLAVDNALSRLMQSERVLCNRDRNAKDMGPTDDASYIGDNAVFRWLEGVESRVQRNTEEMDRDLALFDDADEAWNQILIAQDLLSKADRSKQDLEDRESELSAAEAHLERCEHAAREMVAVEDAVISKSRLPVSSTHPGTEAIASITSLRDEFGHKLSQLVVPKGLAEAIRTEILEVTRATSTDNCDWLSLQDSFARLSSLVQRWISDWPLAPEDPGSPFHKIEALLMLANAVVDSENRLREARDRIAQARKDHQHLQQAELKLKQVIQGERPLLDCSGTSPSPAAVADLVEFEVQLKADWWQDSSGSNISPMSLRMCRDKTEDLLTSLERGRTADVREKLLALAKQWAAHDKKFRRANILTHWYWRSRYRKVDHLCHELTSDALRVVRKMKLCDFQNHHPELKDELLNLGQEYPRKLQEARDEEIEAQSTIEDLAIQMAKQAKHLSDKAHPLLADLEHHPYCDQALLVPLKELACATSSVDAQRAREGLQAMQRSGAEIATLGVRFEQLHEFLSTNLEARLSVVRDHAKQADDLRDSAQKDRQGCFGIVEKHRGEVVSLDQQHTAQSAIAIGLFEGLPPNAKSKKNRRRKSSALQHAAESTMAYIEQIEKSHSGGDLDRVRKKRDISKDWATELKKSKSANLDSLRAVFDRMVNVVGATCSRSGSWEFRKRHGSFDLVIVDEVSKATPTELLIPCLLGKRIVLVGDHKQLGPTIMLNSKTRGDDLSFEDALRELDDTGSAQPVDVERIKSNIKRSLYKELFEHYERSEPKRCMTLTEQYRMHTEIMDVINVAYGGQLTAGHGKNQDTLKKHTASSIPWIREDRAIYWIDTRGGGPDFRQSDGHPGKKNEGEARVISEQIVPALLRDSQEKVGVISFYRAQVDRINNQLQRKMTKTPELLERVSVRSVDNFQGSERNAIVLSMVASAHPTQWLRAIERINVAVSRAQNLLIVVGNPEPFMSLNEPISAFYDALYQGAVPLQLEDLGDE